MLKVRINYITGVISIASDGFSFEDFSVDRADEFLISYPNRLADAIAAGWKHLNGEWFYHPAELDIEAQWAAIRAERNALLASKDWTQLSDARVDALAWAVYRQALRDITTQEDPFNIIWPQEP